MATRTISNRNPKQPIAVALITPIVAACPHSGEPQPGSTISVVYKPVNDLIELHAIEEFIAELAGGSDALDLETVVQMVGAACHDALGLPVKVVGNYKLKNGLEMIVEHEA